MVAVSVGLLAGPVGARTVGIFSDESLARPEPGAPLDSPQAAALRDIQALFMSGRFDETELRARALTQSAPDLPEGWYMLGLALANLDRADDALAALRRSADLYKANAQPLVISGDLLRSLGRVDEARAAYQEAAARDAGNWLAFDGLARLAEARGDRDEAIRNYRLAVDQAPKANPTAILHLGLALLGADRSAEALAALAPAAGRDDAPPAILELAARAASETGDAPGARAYLERIAAGGKSPAGRLGLARAALEANDLAAAETQLTQAQNEFPQSAAVALLLGNVYGATRRYELALAAYSGGLKAAPEDPALIKAASMAEMRLGRLDAAVAHAAGLAGRDGATAADLTWLGTLQEMQGQLDAARQSYGKAIALKADDWLALNNLAALTIPGDPAQGLALAERASKLAPDVAAVSETLAWAAFKAGDATRAAALYEPLHRAAPGDPVVSYRLGLVRFSQGRKDDGRALIRLSLASDPTFRYADEARRLLADP